MATSSSLAAIAHPAHCRPFRRIRHHYYRPPHSSLGHRLRHPRRHLSPRRLRHHRHHHHRRHPHHQLRPTRRRPSYRLPSPSNLWLAPQDPFPLMAESSCVELVPPTPCPVPCLAGRPIGRPTRLTRHPTRRHPTRHLTRRQGHHSAHPHTRHPLDSRACRTMALAAAAASEEACPHPSKYEFRTWAGVCAPPANSQPTIHI